jgi:hypothetical protein
VLDDGVDIAETAAAMSAIDLIISVDTMTAHLAGALGRSVWTLAAFAPAWWLWHLLPTDPVTSGTAIGDGWSRWYPTMRLFRQAQPGMWDDVMRRVRIALMTGR